MANTMQDVKKSTKVVEEKAYNNPFRKSNLLLVCPASRERTILLLNTNQTRMRITTHGTICSVDHCGLRHGDMRCTS